MSPASAFLNARRRSILESKLSWLKLAYFLGDLKQTDVLVSPRWFDLLNSLQAYKKIVRLRSFNP